MPMIFFPKFACPILLPTLSFPKDLVLSLTYLSLISCIDRSENSADWMLLAYPESDWLLLPVPPSSPTWVTEVVSFLIFVHFIPMQQPEEPWKKWKIMYLLCLKLPMIPHLIQFKSQNPYKTTQSPTRSASSIIPATSFITTLLLTHTGTVTVTIFLFLEWGRQTLPVGLLHWQVSIWGAWLIPTLLVFAQIPPQRALAGVAQ